MKFGKEYTVKMTKKYLVEKNEWVIPVGYLK